MLIRKAAYGDLDQISQIYAHIIALDKVKQLGIGWVADVYPTRATAAAALARADLYVGELNGMILGAAIINHTQLPEYAGGKWQIEAQPQKTLVIHTLVVEPAAAGKGVGKKIMAFYENMARRQGCMALRLDTNANNRNACQFYEKLGYANAGIVACDFNGIPGIKLVLFEKSLSL